MTSHELLKSFVTYAGELCSLLTKENKLLVAGKIHEVKELFPRQKELLEAITLIEQRVIAFPESMKGVDSKLRAQAKASFIKMQSLSNETMVHAEVGLKITEGIREFLQNKVSEERMQTLGYNKDGKMPSAAVLQKFTPSMALISRT